MHKDKQLIIACLLAFVAIQVALPRVSAMTPGTRVRIEPADLAVGLNETFVVQVVIEEASDLGAFQFNLAYDPSILQVTEATLGDFPGSTERSTMSTKPEVDNYEGRVSFGAISFGSGPGASGAGVLATFTCVARGEGSTTLELRKVQVLDTAATTQPVTVEGGRVVVRGAEARTPVATAPTPPPAALTPPSPSPTPMPSPSPPATTPVPTATGPSGGAVLGLMLTALAVAILAIFILRRRPGG